MKRVDINMFRTTGGLDLDFYESPDEAVTSAGLDGDDECEVFLLVSNGERSWAVSSGHGSYGVHTTASEARTADEWFDDEWGYTTESNE